MHANLDRSRIDGPWEVFYDMLLYTNICQLTNLRINVEFFELDGAEIYVTVVAEIVQPLVLVGATHLDEVADELRGLGY